MLKQISQLHSLRGWIATLTLLGVAIIVIPSLNILLPQESFFKVAD
jgi:hypothetical protein